MAISDKEQQSELVPQHKRIAQGAALDGTSMQPKGSQQQPAQGGLSQAKKDKGDMKATSSAQ
jgi:hypothetical protein